MKNSENDKKKTEDINLINSDNKSQSNKNSKSVSETSQNQNKNFPQKEKKRDSTSSNIQNTSLNISDNQNIQNQNQNIYSSSNNNIQNNFPSKEYFNFSFFKRQMSSRSSDIDYYQDNKEGINEFFNTKCKSIISKDSEKQRNSKKSSELNSLELSSSNLNKDENIILTRANSARTKNCRSNNYIPKTVFFQRNNSNNPSCFYKKHHMGKQNMKNNNVNNNDKI